MSAQKPTTNRIIDYWPSWADNWTRDSLAQYKKGGKKERVDVINISFAIPQNDGSLTWVDGMNPELTKKIIKELRDQGKKVTIAVGGATGNSWNLSNPQAIKTLADNTKKFVDEWGLDGVDIDYEEDFNGRNDAKHAKLEDYILELRKLMPANKYLLTAAVGSVAAYGPKNPGHQHNEWSGSPIYGLEVDLLKKTGHLFDWINVMSYDVFDPNTKPGYDPRQALEAYRKLMGDRADKVVLGIELGPHAWPQNVVTNPNDVKPWLEYAAKNGFGGAMFWTLDFDFGNQKRTGKDVAEGAFLNLASQIMPRMGEAKYNADADKNRKDYKDKRDVASGGLSSKWDTDDVVAPGGPGSKQGADASKAKEDVKSSAAAQKVQQPSVKQGADADKTKKDASNQQKSASANPQVPNVPAASVTFSGDASKKASQAKVVDYQSNVNVKSKDAVKLGIQDLNPTSIEKILKLQEDQERQLSNLIVSYKKIRDDRDGLLKNATPDQQEALKGQFQVHDKQLNDHVAAVKKSFEDQLQHVIGQLKEEDVRRGYKPNK